ncbi:hypothetical protein ACFYN0_05100 [Streptomyces sp. NPDC006704]|uniref:hypothetical protein n=1 Tax=Streptomyces sp. NPDC006704 TaxID=3364760 RepID=UPI003694B5B3
MTMPRWTRARLGMVPAAALALCVAGCGTQHVGDAADGNGSGRPTPPAAATPSAQVDFPCPGETPKSAAPSPSSTAPPTGHYAENHGFLVPIELHGQNRCDGLAVVAKVKKVLEPLRRRGDFDPDKAHTALTGLGYSAGKVRAYQNGSTGVGFLIDIGAAPWCVEGTMDSATTKADAFAGYPDGTGCEPAKGGH